MGRSVSDAAAQAVAKSNKKESTARTLEQVIADIRKNASAGLSVTSADILSLLGVYDITVAQEDNLKDSVRGWEAEIQKLQATNTVLNERIAQLTEQNERFREVYELENHSSSVKIEKVDEFENVKVETLVGTNVSGGHTDEFIAGVAGALNASTSGE
jgi:hypothetical protein